MELHEKFGEGVLPITPFPKPYRKDISKIKAIYLGCDPSNSHSHTLPYVFALESGFPIFKKFLKDHESNLNQVGLSWETVYVQNLCQNYFKKETADNWKLWKEVAKWWIPILKDELKQFDSSIPVMLTSAYLYKVLKNGDKFKPMDYYECTQPIPVPAEESKLERPLIPFYRNRRKVNYHLTNPKWIAYKERIQNICNLQQS